MENPNTSNILDETKKQKVPFNIEELQINS